MLEVLCGKLNATGIDITGYISRIDTKVYCNHEVRHPRCVGSITKNFVLLQRTVEHNYNSSISTVRIQLHVSALYVAIFRLRFLTYRLVIQDVWGVWVGGRGGRRRDLFVSTVGTVTPSC